MTSSNTPRWTRTRPTVAGWYWAASLAQNELRAVFPRIVLVDRASDGVLAIVKVGYCTPLDEFELWAGPILVPRWFGTLKLQLLRVVGQAVMPRPRTRRARGDER